MGIALFRALACGVAGLLAWALIEPTLPADFYDSRWADAERLLILVIASVIGLAAGLHVGYLRGSRRHLIIGGIVGVVFGSAGGLIGYGIGGTLLGMFFPPNVFGTGDFSPVQIAARTLAFLPFGALLGAAIGGARLAGRPILAGLIGGSLAAIFGGLVFDLIGSITAPLVLSMSDGNEVGGVSRAIMAAVLGIGIGFFTAFVDRATRSAWVRLVLGRNEGREWPIDSAQTYLGRDERAHIPLFGDPNVAPLHATIIKQDGSFWLTDQGSSTGTILNGQFVQSAPLNPGDTFQVGSHQMQYLTKNVRAPQPGEGGRHAAYSVGGPGQPQQPVQPMQPVQQPGPAPQTQQPTQAFTPQPRQQAPQAIWTLVATSGPAAGTRYPVHDVLEMGRETQGISLAYDTMASRRHVRLTPSPASLQIEDLGSTNGTLVNGSKIQQANLNAGDTLQAGSTQFRVERA